MSSETGHHHSKVAETAPEHKPEHSHPHSHVHNHSHSISATQRMLNTWAIVLILWSVYRAHFKTELPIWLDEFIVKPSVFLLPLYYYIRAVEVKPFWKSLDLKFKGIKWDILLGLGVGSMFLISGAAANWVKFGSIMPPHPRFSAEMTLPLILAISFASSFSEELLMRGFVLKRLYEESKNMWTSSFFTSILFFFLHIPMLFTNNNMTGYIILQVMATDLILSLAVSFMYLGRKNVWVPIIVHALYNLSLYLFL